MKFLFPLLLTVFLLVSSRGLASSDSDFVPVDSSPDASFFLCLEGRDWKKVFPSVSRDFYKASDQSENAFSKKLISWKELAAALTSISIVGGEGAQRFLNEVNEEVSPFIFHQKDGTYLALRDSAHQPAQFSPGIFTEYAAWREKHYRLYQTFLAQEESDFVDRNLLEKQAMELAVIDDPTTIDPSNAAYRLATEQELADWQTKQGEALEAPSEGKTYGLLVINTKNMKTPSEAQRAESSFPGTEPLLGSKGSEKKSSSEDALTEIKNGALIVVAAVALGLVAASVFPFCFSVTLTDTMIGKFIATSCVLLGIGGGAKVLEGASNGLKEIVWGAIKKLF